MSCVCPGSGMIIFGIDHTLFIFVIHQESDVSLHKPALEALRSQIRASTSSMTSVPKPLKYLRQHFSPRKEIYDTWGDGENKVQYMYLFSGLFKFMFYFSLQAFRSNLVNMLRGGRIILYSVPVSTFLETYVGFL